jgi:hypothetical protein
MSTDHHQHLRQIVAGIDRQMEAWDRLLIEACDEEEIRKLVDGLTHLQIARERLIVVFEEVAQELTS